jgi:FixJ family two-component response regulator
MLSEMIDPQKIVCIIDDDADMRKAIERILSLNGYLSRSFASVSEFHTLAKPKEAVCLILDIHLKDESGIDLKRQLSKTAPALPVIFITGRDNDTNRLAVQQVGCAAYLAKPFESKALLQALETATRTKS